MKKLSLSLEALEVQSFTTSEGAPARGTVRAEQDPCTCYTCTCPNCHTCDETCPNTCAHTCDDDTCVTCAFSCYDSCDYTCHTGFCACNQSDFGSCIC